MLVFQNDLKISVRQSLLELDCAVDTTLWYTGKRVPAKVGEPEVIVGPDKSYSWQQ